jgi:hypothetical protein
MTRGFLRFLRGNTIALLALFLALGGTTYAASTALIGKNTVASPQVVNGSLKTKDLSAAARKALKGNRGLRGLTGAQGAKGATGAQGVQGIQGIQGIQGVAGTARAYAEVDDSTPSLVAARTKNFTAVSRPGVGVYCLTPAAGIDARAVASVASVDYGISGVRGVAEVRGSGLGCPAGDFEVETYSLADAAVSTISFHLIVP